MSEAPRAGHPGAQRVGDVDVVVDRDAARAGRAVRERIDADERVAGFVGDSSDPACAEFVADVIRPTPPPGSPDA